MDFDLRKTLLALLYSTSDPIAPKTVQKLCALYRMEYTESAEENEVDEGEDAAVADEADAPVDTSPDGESGAIPSLITQAQIRQAFADLQSEAETSGAPYRVIEGPQGFQLTSAPEYAPWVRLLRGEPVPQRLSAAALETAAIIAYRQPVSRAEIEAIRGVSVDGPLSRLLELDLVHAVGRADLPGRPIQYGTTERFLEFCGVTNLESLPASDVLSNRDLDQWLHELESGDNIVEDEGVGLAAERKQGELPLEEDYVVLKTEEAS
jgi:segregation and condensation protein B